jgi:hypothetical protein
MPFQRDIRTPETQRRLIAAGVAALQSAATGVEALELCAVACLGTATVLRGWFPFSVIAV